MAKKEKLSVEPYKGVRDFYPEDQAFLNYFKKTASAAVERVGYVEYHASILEPSELYKAKGAENEEMVKEQTYTFTDRGEREVTLRPEMTPTVARMVAAKRRELGFPLRLYSIPNVFRYERPQRGRLREHWQLNVDLFGSHSPYADAEIIGVAYGLMRAFGATENDFVIKLGSRAFLNSVIAEANLSEESGKALLGLLDRRAKMPAEEFSAKLGELGISKEKLESEAPEDIRTLIGEINDAGIGNVVFDPSVVRGFAYYTGIVFEVFDTHPNNNRSLFGGGRYDNLTEMFDDEPTPGVGFGMGDVTIRDFLEVRGLIPPYQSTTKVYIAATSPGVITRSIAIATELRKNNVNVAIDLGEKKLGDQIKTAAKHKIPYLIVIGVDEIASDTYTIRNLDTGEETKLERTQLANFFKQ